MQLCANHALIVILVDKDDYVYFFCICMLSYLGGLHVSEQLLNLRFYEPTRQKQLQNTCNYIAVTYVECHSFTVHVKILNVWLQIANKEEITY